MTKCTPAYNQETRRLRRMRDELLRVDEGMKTGDFAKAIRAKANELIDEGHSAQDVLDKTHEFVNQYAPHEKSEVSDVITGSKRAAPTKNEARKRRDEIKSELRDLERAAKEKPAPADSEITRNKTRQTVLKKQLAELNRRFREGDFSKPEPKNKPLYNDDTLALQREVNIARNKVDGIIARREARNQSWAKKTADVITNVQLFSILSSLHVYPKLAYAVLARWATSPLESATVSLAKAVIPGLKKYADLAPRHGQGFVAGAEKEAFTTGIKEGAKGFKEQLVYGQSKLDATFGAANHVTDEFTDYMGEIGDSLKTGDYLHAFKVVAGVPARTHAMIKEFASQPEFYRSFYLRDRAMRNRMEANGTDKATIDEFMERESTKALIGAKAMEDALESKMQGKNRFADSVNSFVVALEKGGAGEKALALVFRVLFPIRKVPINIFKETTSYTAGGLKALTRMRYGDLNEANAEYIMKNIGKQGVGAMLFAVGYLLGPAVLGGIPMSGDKKRKPEVTPGAATIGGVDIGTEAFHGPAAQMLQLGSGWRRLYEKDYGAGEGAVEAGLHALGSNYAALATHTIPYLDTPRRMLNTAQYGRGGDEIVGNQIRSIVIPQAIQQGAAAKDPYKGYRSPRNIAEDVKLGIPGLRETVPEKKAGKHKNH